MSPALPLSLSKGTSHGQYRTCKGNNRRLSLLTSELNPMLCAGRLHTRHVRFQSLVEIIAELCACFASEFSRVRALYHPQISEADAVKSRDIVNFTSAVFLPGDEAQKVEEPIARIAVRKATLPCVIGRVHAKDDEA